ncbi:MAG: S9 family peptidase, partial [Opitutaceae bacterium]|nr:S9 family peptidase [Opitutaceae bacterium]
MRLYPTAILCLSLVFPAMTIAQLTETADPFVWLEDVHSERALTWVRTQNALTEHELGASPDFKPVYDRLLAIYDS